MLAALAYHVPFAVWTLLCVGALFAFTRAVTTPPRDDLETRGVFSTLSERLGQAANGARMRRALLRGLGLGIPTAVGASAFVWRVDPYGSLRSEGAGGSTMLLIGVGWLLLSVAVIAGLSLGVSARRAARGDRDV